MAERMSHAEYVESARKQAAAIAAGILNGSVNVLEGAFKLDALRQEVEVEKFDEDFTAFLVIASETDALPIGAVRERWSTEALVRLEPEIQAAMAWAMGVASPACKSIVRRFGA